MNLSFEKIHQKMQENQAEFSQQETEKISLESKLADLRQKKSKIEEEIRVT